MVAVKAQDADRIAAKPPAEIGFYLCYGPDSGLATERAGRIAAAFADPTDPFSLIKLDAATIASDPNRLADEAYAIPMFGGRRAIWLREAGSRASIGDIVAGIMKRPPPETRIILEAGDLRKGQALRALFERETKAYAIACYEDDAGAIGRLVDEEVKLAGLTITPEARSHLVAQLGGDRLLSRNEIQKLCLFAHGNGRIEREDVDLMVGDSAGIGMDELTDATATGDLSGLGLALQRAAGEGLDPGTIALMSLRYFQSLEEARGIMSGGVPAEDVVKGLRPPVFYKRVPKMVTALEIWSPDKLSRASKLLGDAIRDCRLNSSLARDILGDTLITLCRVAAQGRRR